MVSPLKVSSGQFPFHCSLGVSTRKARLAGVLHPVVDIVAIKLYVSFVITVVSGGRMGEFYEKSLLKLGFGMKDRHLGRSVKNRIKSRKNRYKSL